MTTQTTFKLEVGQVFWIRRHIYLDKGYQYYPVEITRVCKKWAFFTLDGNSHRGTIYRDSAGNEELLCESQMLCISNELPTVNPETIETSVNEVIEPIAIETTNNVVNFADYRSKVSQVSVNEPIEVETISDNPSANLETLGFPKADTLETPQDSTHELDRFEVVYQVADLDDEVSYESSKVYALSHDHAKAIVSQDLQAQHLRYIITDVQYALVIDDLSEFSLVDEF